MVSSTIHTTSKPPSSFRKLLAVTNAQQLPVVFTFELRNGKDWVSRMGIFKDSYLYWGDADTRVTNAVQKYRGTVVLERSEPHVVTTPGDHKGFFIRAPQVQQNKLSERRQFNARNVQILYVEESGGVKTVEGLVDMMNRRRAGDVPDLFDTQRRAERFRDWLQQVTKEDVVAYTDVGDNAYDDYGYDSIKFDAELLESSQQYNVRHFVLHTWIRPFLPILQILPDIVLSFSGVVSSRHSNVVSVSKDKSGILVTAIIPGYDGSHGREVVPHYYRDYRFRNIRNKKKNLPQVLIYLMMKDALRIRSERSVSSACLGAPTITAPLAVETDEREGES